MSTDGRWCQLWIMLRWLRAGQQRACSQGGVAGWASVGVADHSSFLLLYCEFELHFPFVWVMGIVEGHMVCQDLAHDEDFCVLGDVKKLCCHQRVTVVGLEWKGGGMRCLGKNPGC